MSNVAWYEVLGHFKLAVIVQQIYARYVAGAMGDDIGAEITAIGDSIPSLVASAEAALAGG